MMTLAVLTIAFLTIGAVALALVDQALGPENGYFPCAHPLMHWAIRIYALALFNWAARLTSHLWAGLDGGVGWDVCLGTLAMAVAHGVLLSLLLRARLPIGVWPRLERRLRNEKSSGVQRL